MQRRDFIAGLGGVAVAWPLSAPAQQSGKVYRMGIFVGEGNALMAPAYRAFLDELRSLGLSEGQNLVIDQRPTDQTPAALARNVAEMLRAKADVIVAAGTQPALQAAVATGLPIIISANNYDPIAHGYVKSLAQPGGNVSGVMLRQTELAEKQVELLAQAFPERKRLALLWDAISADQFSAAERRAQAMGLDVVSTKLENASYDFAAAFRRIQDSGAQMLLSLSRPLFGQQIRSIVDLSVQHRLPAMFIFRSYVEFGGLMSYGADTVAMYRQTAVYVAKVLRGAKPADLPVEQPNKYELAINLRTAKAIGIELPTSILLRADHVIE